MEYKVPKLRERILAAFPSLGAYGGYVVGQKTTPGELKENISDSLLNLKNEIARKGFKGSPIGNNPYWDVIDLEYTNDDGSVEKYTFPNDPIVSCSLVKKLTKTEIFGGISVVETSGNDNAEFVIRGVLWNNDLLYPEQQVADLLDMFREGREVIVKSSEYFNIYGVSRLIMKTLNMPGIEGFSDSQPFVITCEELRTVTLNILEK